MLQIPLSTITLVNDKCIELLGYSRAELLGATTHSLNLRVDDALNRIFVTEIQAHGRVDGIEVTLRHKDGTHRCVRISSYPLMIDGQYQFLHTIVDITDHKNTQVQEQVARERIHWLSHFDALTGLPNRTLLAERCSSSLSAALRDAKPVAVVMLGIDRFKQVNDTLGHAIGDHVLKQIAQRMTEALRDQDTLARVGGDEFALVLPGMSSDSAATLTGQLMRLVRQAYTVDQMELSIKVSMGIAMYPDDGQDFQSLFERAEIAMHQAKENAHAAPHFFSAVMYKETLAQAAMEVALRSAIAENQLQLHYQPFADMQTGHIGGMEGLLRWQHPELGAVSPTQFIPLAEKSGLIVEIGAWVFRRACQDIHGWRRQGIVVPPVSVNVSPVQFRDVGLLTHFEATLHEFAIEPSMICIEVTEGALMEDVNHSEILLRSIKALGLKLALDDFGTGYSSLGYLKLFPFDKVKIDQSFVRNIVSSQQDAMIAKVVITMAHGLGLRVIAEGVETEVQCEFMRSNVCDEIQGYFFSHPIPRDKMAVMLAADERLPSHLLRMRHRAQTLLLVNDEPSVIAALKQLFQSDIYQVLSANSGQEGLALLAQHPVDVILSDQRMPGMSGVQFLREAQKEYPDTLRIVLSDHTELQSVTDAINEGAIYRFLTTPWEGSTLRLLIEEALQNKALADENRQLNLKVRTTNQELASSNRQLVESMQGQQQLLAMGVRNTTLAREALVCIPLPIFGLDGTGTVIFASDEAKQLFAHAGLLLGAVLVCILPELASSLMTLPEKVEQTVFLDRAQPYRMHWVHLGPPTTGTRMVIIQKNEGPASHRAHEGLPDNPA
jgi:diguanylate cyclase (GGDEF)-like protein/PAS domain S-box-containing protein